MALPTFDPTQRHYGAGIMWAADEGTVTSSYTPTVAAHTFNQGTTSTTVPGSTSWRPLGVTSEDGITFAFGTDWEDDMTSEYYYPINKLQVGSSCTVTATFKQLNVHTLRRSFNLASSGITGTPSTASFARISPAQPGQEVAAQLMWEAVEEDLVIIIYRVFQTGSVEWNPKKGADGLLLPLEFTGLLPASTVSASVVDFLAAGTQWADD